MSTAFAIARPYAKALFEVTTQDGNVSEWLPQLEKFAEAASHPEVLSLLVDPKCTQQHKIELFIKLASVVDKKTKLFITLLAARSRLSLLPEIAKQFAALYRQQTHRLEVTVISARPLNQITQDRLVAALKKRFRLDIDLSTRLDHSLIGGAVIRIGDQVIDGSLSGKINKIMNHFNLNRA